MFRSWAPGNPLLLNVFLSSVVFTMKYLTFSSIYQSFDFVLIVPYYLIESLVCLWLIHIFREFVVWQGFVSLLSSVGFLSSSSVALVSRLFFLKDPNSIYKKTFLTPLNCGFIFSTYSVEFVPEPRFLSEALLVDVLGSFLSSTLVSGVALPPLTPSSLWRDSCFVCPFF